MNSFALFIGDILETISEICNENPEHYLKCVSIYTTTGEYTR